jgi:hypothetical protein
MALFDGFMDRCTRIRRIQRTRSGCPLHADAREIAGRYEFASSRRPEHLLPFAAIGDYANPEGRSRRRVSGPGP